MYQKCIVIWMCGVALPPPQPQLLGECGGLPLPWCQNNIFDALQPPGR
jgi:hypothetical protein